MRKKIPVPDMAKHFEATRRGQWGVWHRKEQWEDFTKWGWGDAKRPEDFAQVVMEEINKNAMSDLDIGEDGIVVVTFGILEFETPLCATLPDLVEDLIYSHLNAKTGFVDQPDEIGRLLRTAAEFERLAVRLRARLQPEEEGPTNCTTRDNVGYRA